MLALPQELLVSILQQFAPTAEELAAIRESLGKETRLRNDGSLTALTAAEVHARTEKEVGYIRNQLVLACALICHSAHDAVKAWIQMPANQATLEVFTLRRIRAWQNRTDAILPGVFAGRKRRDVIDVINSNEEARGVQDFAEGLFGTLREQGRLSRMHLAQPPLFAMHTLGVPTRLHLRWLAVLAFVHIVEEDALQLLAAVMRFRVARMQDEEEEPSVESRDLSFCIKERTREQAGAERTETPINLPWWAHMPIWSIISGAGSESSRREVIEQLAAAGPTLEVQLAIVQRLAARAGIKRFSGDATKLIWQYVMLQAAALLVRATTPVRELLFPQRVHEKRVDDGLSEASEEEEEMGLSDYEDDGVDDRVHDGVDDDDDGDAREIEALIRVSEIEAQEDSDGSDSEQEGEVEEGDECDARWDEEEGEWVLLPSTACFEGAAGWLREGNLRGRAPFYLGRTSTRGQEQQRKRSLP